MNQIISFLSPCSQPLLLIDPLCFFLKCLHFILTSQNSETFTTHCCHNKLCTYRQVVLCLSYHESIRISSNIMLPEEECYNKIKLYTSDSFVENSTSNCVIISGQFEIFKTSWSLESLLSEVSIKEECLLLFKLHGRSYSYTKTAEFCEDRFLPTDACVTFLFLLPSFFFFFLHSRMRAL